MSRKTVDGTVFNIPHDRLVNHDVAFLPASQNEGLTFLLNPGASGPEEIMVSVDASKEICARAANAVVDMVPRACAVATGKTADQPVGALTKAFEPGTNETQWAYRNDQGTIAMCTTSPQGGSCTATFAWRDKICSISLNDSEMPRLTELRAEVRRLLDTWSQG